MDDGVKKNYNKERCIQEDYAFITSVLAELPENNAFVKLIKHNLYFYAEKARKYKLLCLFLSALTILFPAIVTAISALSDITPFCCKLAIAMLSTLSSVSAGAIGVFNLREQWISYRTSCEKLKMEISKYLTKAEPYNDGDNNKNDSMFINNCEIIIENEGKTWIGNIRDNNQEG